MDNLKIYQLCHDLIDYFATLTSPKKSYLGPIFRTGGSKKNHPPSTPLNPLPQPLLILNCEYDEFSWDEILS